MNCFIIKSAADSLSGKVHAEYEDRFDLAALPKEAKGIKPDIIRQGVLREVKDGDEIVAYARIRSYQKPGEAPKFSLGIKHFPLSQESETEISEAMFKAFYPKNLDKPQEKKRYKVQGWDVDEKDDGSIVAEKEGRKGHKPELPEGWKAK